MNLTRWKQQFRGPLSSALLNSAFEEIYEELGKAIEYVQHLSENKQTLTDALSYQLNAIAGIYGAENTAVDNMNATRGILHRNMYIDAGITNAAGTVQATVNTIYGVAHLPIGRKLSMIPQQKNIYGESVADPLVKIYLNDNFQPSDTNIYEMLHRKTNAIWFEKNVGAAARTIRIVFPKAPNTKLNYIEFQPVPILNETINNIQIKNYSNLYQLPYESCPAVNNNAMLCFENNAFNDAIQFDLTPWNIDGGVYGMKYFDCGYADYIGTANIRFTLSSAVPGAINTITHIFHEPNNLNFVHPGPNYLGFLDNPPVKISLRKNSHAGALLWDNVNYAYPQDSGISITAGGITDIYVEIEFTRMSDCTPIFQNITIYYG